MSELRETSSGRKRSPRHSNVADDALRNLRRARHRVHRREFQQGDHPGGQIPPKGETELSAGSELGWRYLSVRRRRGFATQPARVPHGERGIVVDVKVFSRENKDSLAGINEMRPVYLARSERSRPRQDGRPHGNKGVVPRSCR